MTFKAIVKDVSSKNKYGDKVRIIKLEVDPSSNVKFDELDALIGEQMCNVEIKTE